MSTVAQVRGTALLHLADHLLPGGGERELVRALRALVGRLSGDDPVDPERPPPLVGAGQQIPDVVLVDEVELAA